MHTPVLPSRYRPLPKNPVRGLDRAQRFKKGDGVQAGLRPGSSGAHAQGEMVDFGRPFGHTCFL